MSDSKQGVVGLASTLKTLYPSNSLSMMLYGSNPGTLFGLDRAGGPLRLAGVRITGATKIDPLRCSDPEHLDCLVSEEIALQCWTWTKERKRARSPHVCVSNDHGFCFCAAHSEGPSDQ